MIEHLKQYGSVSEHVLLSKLTTIKLGGTARALFYPNDFMGLIAGIAYLHNNDIEFRIFGHGSNILASDLDYDGVIIKLNRTINSTYFLEDRVFVEAGASLVLLSDLAMKQSLSGLEWAAGIPATLGGALVMNAGAYLKSMSDIVTQVLILDHTNLRWLSHKECDFNYRSSIFQKNRELIILGAQLKLEKESQEIIKEVMARRKQQRLNTQPLDAPSSGSTFRNPLGYQSWELIEGCGLRGFKVGGAQVSKKHANFLINEGDATAQDMINLIHLIQQSVKDKYAVDLHLEVEQFNWK